MLKHFQTLLAFMLLGAIFFGVVACTSSTPSVTEQPTDDGGSDKPADTTVATTTVATDLPEPPAQTPFPV